MRVNVSGNPNLSTLSYGSSAQDLNATLKFSTDWRHVVSKVDVVNGSTVLHSHNYQEIAAGISTIELIANGAAGKDGLHGQDGAPGRPGRDGENATEYRAGTDGSPGGNGEDGQPGTNGGPGGHGGDVTINVAQDDTDILSVVSVQNYGGPGGAAGQHGRGGAGGRGGRGGAPYYWYKTVYEPVQRSETVYDTVWENGQSRTVSRTIYVTVQEERRISCSNMGGMDGLSGSPGNTPSWPLFRGSNGAHGALAIKVTCDGGLVKKYTGFYNPLLLSFTSASSTRNGIYEPGDTIEVSGIKIRNDGAMPTPRGKRLSISIVSDAAMSSNTHQIELIDEIPAKTTVDLPGSLFFTLKEYTGNGSPPLLQDMSLDLKSVAVRLTRQLPNFTNPQAIKLSHPIKIEKVCNPRAITAREFTSITFTVQNISLKELGKAATLKALQREIKLACGLGASQPGGGRIVFCDENGKTLHASALVFKIAKINAGKSIEARCFLKVENNKEAHCSHSMISQLQLQKIGPTDQLKCVHAHNVHIKEGVPYTPQAKDDFLLVTNAETTAEELAAWRAVAQELGLSFTVWDTAVYRHMQLSKDLPDNTNPQSIISRWQGKLLVVLNQPDPEQKTPLGPMGLISQKDFDEAIRISNIRVYSVGSPVAADKRPSLMEELPLHGKKFYASLSDLKKSPREAVLSSKYAHVVNISRGPLLGLLSTAEKCFKDDLEDLRRYLDKKHPEVSFLIIPQFDAKVTGSWCRGYFKSRDLGRIEIQREETPRESLVLGVSADPDTVHTADFVKSKINKVSLLASLSHERLVDLFVKALTDQGKSKTLAEIVMDALTVRIAAEAGFTTSSKERHVYNGLPTLRLLHEQIAKNTDSTNPPMPSVIASLVARLKYLRVQELSWYQRFLPFSRSSALAKELHQGIETIEQHTLSCLGKKERSFYKKLLGDVLRVIQSNYSSREKSRLLDGLVMRSLQPKTSMVTHNPYVSKEDTDPEYARNFLAVEAQVADDISLRAKIVKSI